MYGMFFTPCMVVFLHPMWYCPSGEIAVPLHPENNNKKRHRLWTIRLSNISRNWKAESIYVLREVAAQFERPVILFSGGKDSIVITYLAYKAFYPAKIPFPLLHIDTGHNFKETIQYRDELAKKLGAELIVGSVQESIDKGRVKCVPYLQLDRDIR